MPEAKHLLQAVHMSLTLILLTVGVIVYAVFQLKAESENGKTHGKRRSWT